MEVRVSRAQFLAELTPMQGIVERRTTIPILSHILVSTEGDKLHLAATDLDVSLTSWCEGEVKQEGGVAVQARKFIEIIRSVAGDEIHLKLENERHLSITAGPSRFKINGLEPKDFPTLPAVAKDSRIPLPFNEIKKMIGKVIFAVSTEESRFQLNGALVKLKDGGLEIVATDGHRLALVENELSESTDRDGVLVPRKALLELQRFEDDGEVDFYRGEQHLSFKLGRRELICRILEGTFPDYERVIAKDNDKIVEFGRRELADAIQRVALLTGDRARGIKLEFAPERLVISAANPDLGEAVEELACEYQAETFKIGMNPDYLSQFLSAVDTERVVLHLKDENTQCVGRPVEGGDARYLCVIMPMRI